MTAHLFEDRTPAQAVAVSAPVFSGVLDSPAVRKVHLKPHVVVAGWITPIGTDESYMVRIEGTFGLIVETPQQLRPDVVNAVGALPLAGQEQFCGFSIKVPFSPTLTVSVEFSSGVYHWKTLVAEPFQSVLTLPITRLLSHGIQDDVGDAFADAQLVSQTVDVIHGSTVAYWPYEFDSIALGEGERDFFRAFLDYLSSASFFYSVLCANRHAAPRIPAPFGEGKSKFLGSIFDQINFLVFAVEGERFYIGQNLHSADFVYFPSRSIASILPHGKYELEHLKGLIDCAATQAHKFVARENANVSVYNVAINGISPYHFFYDALPALYIASQTRRFKMVDNFFAINSRSYVPLHAVGGRFGDWLPATAQQLAQQSKGLGSDAMCVAGVNYKALSDTDIFHMDEELLVHALSVCEFSQRYAMLESYGLVIWVGISTQKRAWLNQKDALVSLLTRLYKRNPNTCVVFDGMTADIFADTADASFSDDAAAVADIVADLPAGLASLSLVGCGSTEKIFVASKCHFFVANYSTGSIFPARFCALPGVAHLSNAMLERVRAIHIHPNTHLVPAELVIDVPDPTFVRVDFVSYSIDVLKFCDFVEQVLFVTLRLPRLPIKKRP